MPHGKKFTRNWGMKLKIFPEKNHVLQPTTFTTNINQ